MVECRFFRVACSGRCSWCSGRSQSSAGCQFGTWTRYPRQPQSKGLPLFARPPFYTRHGTPRYVRFRLPPPALWLTMLLRRFSLRLNADNRGHAMVDFPSIDGAKPVIHPPETQAISPAHLPFRRISLPSAPNVQRQSIVSIASFDSIAEGPHPPASSPMSRVTARGTRHRPSSVDPNRRNNRRREVKSVVVVDGQREGKRRRVIHELHDTERTYVDGLELIYSVSARFYSV